MIAPPAQAPHTLGKFLLALFALYATAQSVSCAWQFDWTYDESWHLTWNKAVVERHSTSRAMPGNYQSTTPILVGNVALGQALMRSKIVPAGRDLFAQRIFNVVWVVALVLSTFVVARSIAGPGAGLLASAAVAADPNLAAHGALATVDLSFAATVMLALATYLRLIRAPSIPRAIFFGAAVGLVLTAKFSGVLLPAALLLSLPLLRIFSNRPLRRSAALVTLLFVAIGVSLATVGAAYLFIGVGEPLGAIGFYSRPFLWLQSHFPYLRLPLPMDFLTGVDQCISKERGMAWNVIFLGQLYPHGTWQYFPVVLFFKTPLFLIALTICGFTLLAFDPETRRQREIRFLLAVLGIHLFYFMFIFQTQVGIRYVLFCVPLLYVIASCAIAENAIRIPRWIFVAGFCSVLFEVWPFQGNLISFSNAAMLPKTKAVEYFADSNLDWGQMTGKANQLAARDYPGAQTNPVHVMPGVNLIWVNMLSGVWFNFPQYRWVRENLKPERSIEHVLYVYSVSDQQFENMLEDTRTHPFIASSLDNCSGPVKLGPLIGEQTIAVSFGQRLCVNAVTKSTIRINAPEKELNFGFSTSWKGCGPMDNIKPKQEAWYVLEPGMHEFCVTGEQEPAIALDTIKGEAQFGVGSLN